MKDIYIRDIDEPLYHMDDANILSVSAVSNSSLLADKLAYDEATIKVSTEPVYIDFVTSDDEPIETDNGYMFNSMRTYIDFGGIQYGDAVIFLSDDELIGKYYAKSMHRTGKYTLDISAVSPIGMLDTQYHTGGIYTGTTFSSLLAEIIGDNFSYSVDTEVASQTVYGWLPYDTARNNLHQLLFAYGVNIIRDDDGDMYFKFPDSDTVTDIPDSKVFIGGSVSYAEPTTEVEITEHSFFISGIDTQKTLFDNTDGSETADRLTVKFSNPCYELETTDTLVIDESGVNYAIVSGVGTLTGYEYAHSTKVISRKAEEGDSMRMPKTTSVQKVYLIGPLNSANVAKRALSYYNNSNTVSASILLDTQKPGDLIEFTNPFGDRQQGFISSMQLKATSILKAQCSILSGYVPTGNGNNYSNYVVLTGSGNWVVPAGITQIRATLIGGGSGGASGGKGGNGGNGQRLRDSGGWALGGSANNNGGVAGEGGLGGKMLTITLDVSSGNTFSYIAGKGGTGGAYTGINSNGGTTGTDTTFGTYTSSSGARNELGLVNLFTNENYSARGQDGIKGGTGGTYSQDTGFQSQPDANGDDVLTWTNPKTKIIHTWRKGTPGTAARGTARGDEYVGHGGFGGGYAVGSDGGNGHDGEYSYYNYPRVEGGDGGAGADADNGLDGWLYGQGGMGGHGGGGTGGGGCANWDPDSYSGIRVYGGNNPGGLSEYDLGGKGGNGGRGADGCVLIYY